MTGGRLLASGSLPDFQVAVLVRCAILAERMLHWPSMRILAVAVMVIFSILSVGCTADGVMLQPPVQGEWSNFHNDQDKVSKDARESTEKPPADK